MARMKDKQFVVICNWFHEIVFGIPGKQEIPQELERVTPWRLVYIGRGRTEIIRRMIATITGVKWQLLLPSKGVC